MPETTIDNTGLAPGFRFEDPSATTTSPVTTTETATEEVEKPIELIPVSEPTETQTQTQGTPTVNELEILNSIFGEGHPYKTIEEVKGLRIGERLTAAEKLQLEHVNATKAIENYKARVSLMESPQFLQATKYSHFAKEAGIEVDFGTFQKLEKFDPSQMNDIDKIVLLDYLKFQDKGKTREEVMQQYRLGDYAEEVANEDGDLERREKETDKRALGREAVLAGKELSQLKEKIASFKPEFQDNSAEIATRQEQWKEAPQRMVPFFKTLDLPITEVKGFKVDAPYQYTSEDHAVIQKEIQLEIEQRGYPELTQDNVNAIYLSVQRKMKDIKEKDRFELFANKLIANVDMSLKARYSNYTGFDAIPQRKSPAESVKVARTDGAMTPKELATQMQSEQR